MLKTGYAVILLAFLIFSLSGSSVGGHGTGGTTKEVGDFLVRFRTFPLLPSTEEATIFFFSIEDRNFQHLTNITTAVSVLRGSELIKEFPKEQQKVGDFGYNFVFPEEGAYRLILLIHEPDSDAPQRVEFEVSASRGLSSQGLINIIIPILVVTLAGLVLFKIFRGKKS